MAGRIEILQVGILETADAELIRSICLHPQVCPYIIDDSVPDPRTWMPSIDPLGRYLLATDSCGFMGFAAFLPKTFVCWEAHFAFLPRAHGGKALEAMMQMSSWMWDNTSARRIVGEIDIRNRRAIAFVRRAGYAEFGVNVKSKLSGGVLRDQVCLGISKP